MAGVITRSNHPDALWPGIKAWFGLNYNKVPTTWSQIFEKETSNKYQERVVGAYPFGLAPPKTEGAPIQYDSDGESYVAIFQHTVYALGYIVTEEEIEDNLYSEVSQSRSRNLAWSLATTAEYVHANVFNRGFSTSYPIGDGAAFFSAAHPTQVGNQSNLLSAADFSEAAMEDATKAIWRMQNDRGFPVSHGVRQIVVNPEDSFTVTRVLNSVLRSGSANNDINALNAMGIVPKVVVNKFLSDIDSWFVQTDVPEGMKSFWRREVSLERVNDFDTGNAKAKADMRFSAGPADWRCMYGNAGS